MRIASDGTWFYMVHLWNPPFCGDLYMLSTRELDADISTILGAQAEPVGGLPV